MDSGAVGAQRHAPRGTALGKGAGRRAEPARSLDAGGEGALAAASRAAACRVLGVWAGVWVACSGVR
jgi:hypothetical protein